MLGFQKASAPEKYRMFIVGSLFHLPHWHPSFGPVVCIFAAELAVQGFGAQILCISPWRPARWCAGASKERGSRLSILRTNRMMTWLQNKFLYALIKNVFRQPRCWMTLREKRDWSCCYNDTNYSQAFSLCTVYPHIFTANTALSYCEP